MRENPVRPHFIQCFEACAYVFMHVPCWKLPALHRAVRARPQGAGMEVAGGYAEVLKLASAKA